MWTNDAELNGKAGVDDDDNGYVDDIYGYDFANKDADPKDDHGHGSHVSGTIGAKGNDGKGIVGVTWNVRIMALKFLTASGSGTLEGAVKAINYAVKMGAHLTNNSWGGGGFSQVLSDSIKAAQEKGQLFIAAAGNDSSDNDKNPMYPGSYDHDNIISVAALNNKGELSKFSNYGKTTVDVAAPGEAITSCTPKGYETWNGTSMATPHVSGIVALLMSHERSLNWQQLKERVLMTTRAMAGIKSKTLTGGMVNAHYALINQRPPADPNDPANWKNKPYNISSSHPYENKANLEWIVKEEGASKVSVYFEKFETESGYDVVTFHDAQGNLIDTWSGRRNGEFSPTVLGDTLIIRLKSDPSVNHYGFDITKLAFER
jgi:subtilisin family serine protease